MIKSIIVDDEQRAIQVLQILLEEHCPDIMVTSTAGNIHDAYKLIVEERPSLVFLDINMPNGTGLELLEKIKDVSHIKVIFTTAYEEFAIKAFRLSAVDYLLKPIDKDELIQAINRYKRNNKEEEEIQSEYHSLVADILAKKDVKRIAVKTLDSIYFIDLSDILYLCSEKNYTTFCLKDTTLISSKPLGEYEMLLGDQQFMRIHRSYIINLRGVKEYKKKESGVVLSNGYFLEVSKSRKDDLMERLAFL